MCLIPFGHKTYIQLAPLNGYVFYPIQFLLVFPTRSDELDPILRYKTYIQTAPLCLGRSGQTIKYDPLTSEATGVTSPNGCADPRGTISRDHLAGPKGPDCLHALN